ncbi:hypothetical protein CMT75_18435 [Elizabethkingia anophelis]|nr:hypothetical protein [Elizabethkingia anophelis]
MTKQINNSDTSILQGEAENTQEQNKTAFRNALVFDIELLNGEKSSINVIYNNKDVYFEEIVSYMTLAIEKCTKIKAVEASGGSIRNGTYEPIFFYSKREFDRTEILNNPFLRKFHGL